MRDARIGKTGVLPKADAPAGKRWCDVVVGDLVNNEDGYQSTVLKVRIFRALGARDGDEIVSGRDWLRTGRVLSRGPRNNGK